MRRDLRGWEIAECKGSTLIFTKRTSSNNGPRLVFVIQGCNLEDDEGGTYGVFDSFMIDGREPTDEEEDEYSDDLRDLIWETYTE